MNSDRYNQRGVSASKEDVHQAIKNLDKGLFPQAFCKIVPDLLANDPNYCTVMHADGAGTKSSLAYIYWKETGDLSVWKGIAQDAIIMNVDDLLCVGATGDLKAGIKSLSPWKKYEELEKGFGIWMLRNISIKKGQMIGADKFISDTSRFYLSLKHCNISASFVSLRLSGSQK